MATKWVITVDDGTRTSLTRFNASDVDARRLRTQAQKAARGVKRPTLCRQGEETILVLDQDGATHTTVRLLQAV